jgi:hypothetical protein
LKEIVVNILLNTSISDVQAFVLVIHADRIKIY